MPITPTPRISVAMSVYNGERFLPAAIESILVQTFTDFEFLILDDGSTDSSRTIIERYSAQDSRIQPIFRENRGLIASLNQLIEKARAPVIARMDDDDISLPTRFEQQIAFLDANPDYGVVGSWTYDIDENGAPYPVDGPDHPIDHNAFLSTIENGGQLLCHPVAMMRRDVVLAAGGYHAAFRHCEDFDLWLRLANMTKLCSIPERLMLYRHYLGQVSNHHAVEQQTGTAIARLAYRKRVAGVADPTMALTRLPPIEELDTLFEHPGASREVRGVVARGLLYSRIGMSGEGFDILMQHIKEGGSHNGMWRTVLRLFRFGYPARAMKLAAALIGT